MSSATYTIRNKVAMLVWDYETLSRF